MAFAVSYGSEQAGRITVRVASAEEALAKITEFADRGTQTVSVRVAVSGTEYNPEQFEAGMKAGAFRTSSSEKDAP